MPYCCHGINNQLSVRRRISRRNKTRPLDKPMTTPIIRLQRLRLFLLSLLATVAISIIPGVQSARAAWTLSIPPYEEECFFVKPPRKSKDTAKILSGSYELINDYTNYNNNRDGGEQQQQKRVNADPLLVYVMEATSEEKILWRSMPGVARGNFQVPIQNDKGYWMCLQNSSHDPSEIVEDEPEHPDYQTRLVGFFYELKPQLFNSRMVVTPLKFDKQDEWMEKSASVQEELKRLVNHHDYMRVREAKHRMIVERTFEAILNWTLLEATMVILVAVGQVLYLRRFLEQKRYM